MNRRFLVKGSIRVTLRFSNSCLLTPEAGITLHGSIEMT